MSAGRPGSGNPPRHGSPRASRRRLAPTRCRRPVRDRATRRASRALGGCRCRPPRTPTRSPRRRTASTWWRPNSRRRRSVPPRWRRAGLTPDPVDTNRFRAPGARPECDGATRRRRSACRRGSTPRWADACRSRARARPRRGPRWPRRAGRAPRRQADRRGRVGRARSARGGCRSRRPPHAGRRRRRRAASTSRRGSVSPTAAPTRPEPAHPARSRVPSRR